jgi:type III pantothenate kinase
VILLVDAGNSRIKWHLLGQGRVQTAGELPTAFRGRQLADQWHGLRAQAACISSVAGEKVNQAMGQVLTRELAIAGDKQHWLAAQAQAHGVTSHYHPPESLGVDRFVALVAVRRRWEGDWVVVNVGTAMTVDMLTAEGHFLGGLIVPGPALMGDALDRGTARVHVNPVGDAGALPVDTPSAVGQGIAWALWGGVEGMSRRLSGIVQRQPGVLLSGGARGVLRPLLQGVVVEVDELVLEGLACIARDLGYDA